MKRLPLKFLSIDKGEKDLKNVKNKKIFKKFKDNAVYLYWINTS